MPAGLSRNLGPPDAAPWFLAQQCDVAVEVPDSGNGLAWPGLQDLLLYGQ